ncbi:MAG: PLP-dependent transferase [Methanobacteriota archaeon]|nr:MAG: PLP-dependent transferase [Euryarchaeota archaeon]
MSAPSAPRPGTLCVHGGVAPDRLTGALVPPLVQSTTYAWPDLDHPPAITYARAGNATVENLERRLAVLEGGSDAVCFGSGLAAIDALLRCLPRNARVVAGRHLYGGTTRLLHRLHADRLRVDVVDTTNEAALRTALEAPADLVLVETPSNPTLQITDLFLATRWAHEAGALLAVDNTFLTPLYQRPLDIGADLSIHSTTKYLDGHDATLGGAVVLHSRHAGQGDAPDGPLAARLRWIRKASGAVLAPFEAWLTLQGSKTLHLRTREQWGTASRLAKLASDDPNIESVYYPGLPDHDGHEVHRRQANGDGGILAVDLGGIGAARDFVSHLRVFTIAENLGATESVATHPASMTHADLPPERRRLDGISDGLVRLSVGVEDPEDLEADVRVALNQVARRQPVVA